MQVDTPNSPGYLLVYLTRPEFPSKHLLDHGNDPELRAFPMSWGICRTDVREKAPVGAHLFFVAFDKSAQLGEHYHLRAYFKVGARLGHDEAVRRSKCRPNVILDQLPAGRSLEERFCSYVKQHREKLSWPGRRRVLRAVDSGGAGIDVQDFIVELNGRQFVHAYWDVHIDWRRRLEGAYLVADKAFSKVLLSPIPYSRLHSECPNLPPPELLRTSSPRPRHNKRRVRGEALEYLLGRVRQAVPAVVSAQAMAAEATTLIGRCC